MNSFMDDFRQSFFTLVRPDTKVDERRKLLDTLLRSPEFAVEMEAADVAAACTASPFTVKGEEVCFADELMHAFFATIGKDKRGQKFVTKVHSILTSACKDSAIASFLRNSTTSDEDIVGDENDLDADTDNTVSEPGSLFDSLEEA